MKTLKTLIATVAASLLAAAPLAANAGFVLSVDDLSDGAGVNVMTIVDNGSGDGDSLANFISSSITAFGAGGWSVIGNFGTGSLLTGTGPDLTSVATTSTQGGTLRIMLTETDLSFGALGSAPVFGQIDGNRTNGTSGSISWAVYADDSNSEFGLSQLAYSGSSTANSFTGNGGKALSLTDPFSLTLVVDITHTARASTSYDFATHVPEPGMVGLLSVALLGAGVATRRRRG